MNDVQETVVAGILKESAPSEARVALTPQGLHRLTAKGISVVVETGAGSKATYTDDAYEEAGAKILPADEIVARSDALLGVDAPSQDLIDRLRPGQFLFGLLQARTSSQLVDSLKKKGVVAVSLDMIPRTLSSAQSMDALTSQANVAGYKSVLVAADAYARYLPMLMTAAGTVRPAKVLVLGAGVAGLQAIGTAHRLGAVVSGYDVRPATRGDVESLGATFLDLGPSSGEGEGGYARELTPEEQQAQQKALREQIAQQDIVITTAQVPGHKPPLLVTKEALDAMRPGSVVVDLGASELGGNVAGSVPDQRTVTGNGVTVIGAPHLPAEVPSAASEAYARNISDLLLHFLRDGSLTVDPADEIDSHVVVAGLPDRPAAPPAPETDSGGTPAAPTPGSQS